MNAEQEILVSDATRPEMPGSLQRPWLDQPVQAVMTLSREKALYALFAALAVLSRLWDLGFHVMSHDEMVHAQWSWYLFQGRGYDHHPLSHGPFLFHTTALSYYLFGDNEFSARLVPAIIGIVLVVLPYALRRLLGRGGALVASFLFLISPSLLYYSRYIRNDVPIVLWSIVAALAVFRFLESSGPDARRDRWLVVLAAALSLMFATKEVSFFYIAIFGLFLVLLFFARLGAPRWRTPVWEQWQGILLTLLGLVGVIVLATGLFLFGLNLVELFPIHYQDCGQAPLPGAAPGEMRCADAGCDLIDGRCQRPLPVIAGDDVLEFDQTGARVAIRLTRFEMLSVALLIGAVTLVAGGSGYAVVKRLMPFQQGERPALDLILFIGSFTLPFLSHLAISGLSRITSRAFFGVDAAFYSLDYSEAGLLRSAGFAFILLAVSVAVGLWWDWRRWLVAAGVFYTIFVILFTTVFTNGNGLASGMVGSLGYWLEQQAVERGSQPLYYYGLMIPLYEYLPLIGFVAAALYVFVKHARDKGTSRPAPIFVYFLLFWTALTWPIYSIAGEKMPWMTVHFAAPMILAGGWIIGKFIESANWRAIMGKGGWIAILIAPVGLAALVQTISPWLSASGNARPFSGFGPGQLNTTLQFLSALFVLSLSLGVLRWVWQRTGNAALVRTLTGLALGSLALLTIRTAWAFAYTRPDYASEFLVYAHGSPDVRVVMEQIEEISRRTSGELSLDIGYTADGSYPFIWYLRNYPNASQLPNPPGRPDLDKSVILAGDAEWAGIEPYLGDNYACNHYNFMWWPMQDYDNLTWERIRYALINPEMRAAVWDIVFRRDYQKYETATGKTVRLSEWPLRDGLRFCVRRDVVARMWSESASLEYEAEFGTGWPDYTHLEQPAVADLEAQSPGAFGDLNSPHGMAMDADGFLYVADTNNHRVVKLSPQGQVVDTWDSTWWRGLQTWKPNGCLDAADRPLARGDGEFCEPWGIATGPDGKVYVADTWNHRIQVFSSDGRFLNQTGAFGQSGNDVSAAPAQFYGPRDLVLDQGGRVFVSDTGNKRVQVLDADLQYLYSFGGPGIVEGRLDEPVGLAIGPDDLLYVADTWNNRMQVFTLRGDFVREWPVAGWESQSALNKPYVATDSAGRVYVSDPEDSRIIVFDAEGTPLTVLRGEGSSFLHLPTGVLLNARDQLWVSDAAQHRLLRFPALDTP